MESGRPPAVGERHSFTSVIDLGNEPPLGLDGDVEEPIDRRRVSIRWLAATVLAALAGGGLMGGAVWAALDGEYRFAQNPEFARLAARGAGEGMSNIARKSDRMSLLPDEATARQTLRVSTTTRAGNREIVRVRPFIRVASNLGLSPSSFANTVPPFNPVKLMAEEDERPGEGPQIEPTGELTIVMRDLNQVGASARIAATMRSEDVAFAVRQALASSSAGGQSLRPTITASTGFGFGSTSLAYAAEIDPEEGEPFSAIAENVSSMPKTSAEVTGGNGWNERTVVVKKDEDLTAVLKGLETVPEATSALVTAFGPRGRSNGVAEGDRVRVLVNTLSDGKTQPLRVSIFNESGHQGTIALSDNGRYVSVEEPREISVARFGEDESEEGAGIRLYQSIYETALRHKIPQPMIENIIRTFSFDVDLQRRVRPGDSFEVLYAGDEPDNSAEVLYAALTFGDEARRYYRYLTPDDGIVDYYDESGKSAKKFLVRKPMTGGVFRSGFGPRRHPILGYVRMHTGIDWAESSGAPIFAAGNGTVLKAEWDRGGYGRRVEIEHLNGYVTSYSHMSGFARGIQSGTKVRQGQIIGYVGSTGLSTGPHLHYEVMINGNFVDPMRIKLPRGRELDSAILKEFERERARIDSILERGGAIPRVAAN